MQRAEWEIAADYNYHVGKAIKLCKSCLNIIIQGLESKNSNHGLVMNLITIFILETDVFPDVSIKITENEQGQLLQLDDIKP